VNAADIRFVGLLTEVLIVLKDIRTYLEATSHDGHDLGYVKHGCPGCVARSMNERRLASSLSTGTDQ
jgi:hypothetical protein